MLINVLYIHINLFWTNMTCWYMIYIHMFIITYAIQYTSHVIVLCESAMIHTSNPHIYANTHIYMYAHIYICVYVSASATSCSLYFMLLLSELSTIYILHQKSPTIYLYYTTTQKIWCWYQNTILLMQIYTYYLMYALMNLRHRMWHPMP